MRVTLGNKTYIVSWKYVREEGLTQTTICTISEVTPDNTLAEVARGSVGCHHSDTFNKNSGRKLSLERAILQHTPDPAGNGQWLTFFAKPDRKTIWEKYFEMRHGQW